MVHLDHLSPSNSSEALPVPSSLLVERPSPSKHGEDEKRVIYAHRATTDTCILKNAYKQAGIQLGYKLNGALEGDGSISEKPPTGLGLASFEIGKAINGVISPEQLFHYPYSGQEDVAQYPQKKVFEELLKRSAGGESGTMLTRMLMDVCYPYKKQEGDEYVELPAITPEAAYKTGNYSRFKRDSDARFCTNAEVHFAEASTYAIEGLVSVKVAGETVAYQKLRRGDHTALLAKPAIINGVRIPVGSIVNVEQTEEGPHFAFGRLSAYCFRDAWEGVKQFPDVFDREDSFVTSTSKGRLPKGFLRSLETFNRSVGRGVSLTAEDYVGRYLESHPNTQYSQAVREVVSAFDEQLNEPGPQRFVNMLRDEQALSLKAADAVKAYRKHGTAEARELATQLREQTIRRRANYYRIFGVEAVKKIERLVEVRDELFRGADR